MLCANCNRQVRPGFRRCPDCGNALPAERPGGATFTAIDVETANRDQSTICAIGLATYSGNKLQSQWYSLVDPSAEFEPKNIAIHHLTTRDVQGKRQFPEVLPEIVRFIRRANSPVLVSHTPFDRVSLQQAAERWKLTLPENWIWLDSALLARHTWPEVGHRGYNLANLCRKIGYPFRHHHALEDAKAAANVFLAAMQHTGFNLEEWIESIKPAEPERPPAPPRPGNPRLNANGRGPRPQPRSNSPRNPNNPGNATPGRSDYRENRRTR